MKVKGVAAQVLLMTAGATMKARGDLHPLAIDLEDKPAGFIFKSTNTCTLRADIDALLTSLKVELMQLGTVLTE